ncbi:MAG: cytochrome c3 family protein [Deltaproteobacteria bacterium]|nr:cytochrome c3 family protein [Deltaproteobacteria bacterium]
MSALFGRQANTTIRMVLAAAGLGAVGILSALLIFARVPAGTRQLDEVVQPVQFDHRHHVVDDAIDCRYCHQGVEKGASAGIPSTALCMNCHAQVWSKSPRLEPVRQSYFTGKPIPWVRVHQVPDFVYFNHSIHVAKGVGCETCHGRVDQMPGIWQVAPLTMGWCLDCHRNPGPSLRPRDAVTKMGWKPEGDPAALAAQLMKAHDVKTRTSCTTCHR